MERIAAIVEEHLEAHFIKETYSRALVQRCLPNGTRVNLDLIVDAIADQLEIIDGTVRRVVVLLDREGRPETCGEMSQYLRNKLSVIDPSRSFYVGVSDRQIENWILADQVFIANHFNLPSYVYCGDGVAGRGRLASLTGGDLSPLDKARILKATSPSRSCDYSMSLSSFITQINFPWYWASS